MATFQVFAIANKDGSRVKVLSTVEFFSISQRRNKKPHDRACYECLGQAKPVFVLPNLTPKRKKVKRVVLDDGSGGSQDEDDRWFGPSPWLTLRENNSEEQGDQRDSYWGSDGEKSNDYYTGTGE